MRKCLVLLVLSATSLPATASAPPTRESVILSGLHKQLAKEVDAGRFAAATKVADRIEAVWKKAQGANYWKTIDARYAVEQWRRLSKLSDDDSRQVVHGFNHAGRG